MTPAPTAILVNGFPGVSTNSDLTVLARELGFQTERVSAIENFARTDQPFSFASLEDHLVARIDHASPDAPCVIIGFCFGGWLSERALARTRRPRDTCFTIYLAPLLSMATYNELHGLPALRKTLFEPAATFLKGAASAWEDEWLRLSTAPLPGLGDARRIDVTLLSSTDAELDPGSARLATRSSRMWKTLAAESHFFENGRPQLREELRLGLASALRTPAASPPA